MLAECQRMFTTADTIGIIGTGLMGTAIGERLLAAGFRVLAWDREAARLAESGTEAAESAAAVAQRCGCLVLSLPDSRSVGSVLDEISSVLREGSVILDMSTGAPADAQRFAESMEKRGVAFLDATISGSSEQLRRGEALCMVGGAEAAYADCESVLDALGGPVRYLGGSGNAARMKLVTNLVLGLNRAALAEGLALAEVLGLEPHQTLEVMQASAAYSRIMDTKGEKMIAREFSPVARLSQHLKDVRLIQHAGESGGLRLPLTDVHRALLEEAEAAGLGAQDNSAIIEVIRRKQS